MQNIIRKISKGIKIFQQDPRSFSQKIYRFMKPMKKYYRRRYRMSLKKWLLFHQEQIVFKQCSWMGVKAWKFPLDAWIYQEIIYETQPEIIVEIGSANGGATLYFANLLDIIGKGKVVSIDIDRTNYHIKHERIVEITGDSSSPETISKVIELCKNKSVMFIHDGDHSKKQVLEDLKNYYKLVSVNNYFIVEDGIVDLYKPVNRLGGFKDGPLEAVEQFLKENDDFIVDMERERYILTYNPKGFLKRVK